jgi:hypothetical protein
LSRQERGVMLPCEGCAYRGNIPGDSHVKCEVRWTDEELAKIVSRANPHGIRSGWFLFPLNYDPTWGGNECPHRSEVRDKSNLAPNDPLAGILSLLKR